MAVHPAVHMPLFLGFTLQALVVYAASGIASRFSSHVIYYTISDFVSLFSVHYARLMCCCWAVLVSADVSAMVLLFMWCGRAAFFALGNSNSVATVDLSGAYTGTPRCLFCFSVCAFVNKVCLCVRVVLMTGLTSYQPVLVGVLTLVSLYGVPTVFALQAVVAYLRSSTYF